MPTPEPEMRRYLRIKELDARCKELEQKVNRYQDALIDIAAGCDEPDTLASKVLIG